MKSEESATDVSSTMTETSDLDSLDVIPKGGTPVDKWFLCWKPKSDEAVKRGIESEDGEREIMEISAGSRALPGNATSESGKAPEEKPSEVSTGDSFADRMSTPISHIDILLALVWVVLSVVIMNGSQIIPQSLVEVFQKTN